MKTSYCCPDCGNKDLQRIKAAILDGKPRYRCDKCNIELETIRNKYLLVGIAILGFFVILASGIVLTIFHGEDLNLKNMRIPIWVFVIYAGPVAGTATVYLAARLLIKKCVAKQHSQE